MVAFLARSALLAVIALLAVAAAGGGEAAWLGIPLALLAAAPGRDWRLSGAGAALVALGASAPALIKPSLGPAPNAILFVLVVVACVGILAAVRRRLEGERAAMRHWALTDPLTGVANRRGLGERIEYEVARHDRAGRKFAVVMIDLDGFKAVNDRFGHHAGDELLRDVATSIREAVRVQDTVARLGGDEFCVLAPETSLSGAGFLSDRVTTAVRRVTTGLDTLSASVGVAIYPDDGRTPLAVLDAADVAQIEAKRASRRGRERRAA